MTNTRFANLLIDTVDRFASATSAAETWQAMVDTSARVGANSVTCTGFLGNTAKMLWCQSSMASDWVEEYMACDLATADPIIFGLFHQCLPMVVKSGVEVQAMAPDPRRAQLFAGHARHNYGYFTSHVSRSANQTRVVHFSTPRDPNHLFGPGTMRALQSISAIVASHCMPPEADSPATIYGSRYRNLTARERDVLNLMAHGHSNAVIADRLGISDSLVRLAQITARGKMGAVSGEQALAIALTRGLLDL